MNAETNWIKLVCLGGLFMLFNGCASMFSQNCAPPATGQIHWYQNDGAVASCDDFAGFDGPRDVPPRQDGRLMAGCPTEGRFEINGPVVVDNCTGLTWQRTPPSSQRTWVEALVFASDLELGSFDDWRLPNVNELLSLVDYGRTGPALDPVFDVPSDDDVSAPNAHDFWTSTSANSSPVSVAWVVHFTIGDHSVLEKPLERSVRAVRGGFLPSKLPVAACELVVSP